MRILLVHDCGTPTGGAELQMLALRDGLRRRGHAVRLFTSDAQHAPVPVPVLADDVCFGTTRPRLQVLTQTANPSAYLRLRRVLRDFRPDVVHVRMMLWQLSPLILPLLRGRPAVYQAAVYKAVCPIGTRLLPDGRPCTERVGTACLRHGCLTPQSWLPLMLQHRLWHRWRGVFGAVVALSEEMRAVLEAQGVAPVRVIPNGVAPRPPRPPLATPPLVAYAGRLSHEKGVPVLLRAFAALAAERPDARLLVAGDGPARRDVECLVAALGLESRVMLLGHLPRAELERRFDAAWVQVVPSLWAEPFGNVSTEAMARGTAVVASAVGGQRDIVTHERTGLLVPPGDVATLAAALRRLTGDRALAERFGAAGRARALAEFGEERCVERFLSLYHELAAVPLTAAVADAPASVASAVGAGGASAPGGLA